MKLQHSPAFLRKRKFLMVLPLLTLPFLTFLFWALGGGKATNANAKTKEQKGFNLTLPEAIIKEEKALTKLSYYEKAALDSQKLKELIKNDPYYKRNINDEPMLQNETSNIDVSAIKGLQTSPNIITKQVDEDEAAIYAKLEQLDAAIRQPSETPKNEKGKQKTVSVKSREVDRLEQLMSNMNSSESEDKELQQLNGMLNKILDIQHPDRVRKKIKQESREENELLPTVTVGNDHTHVSLLSNIKENQLSSSNGFYGLAEEEKNNAMQNAIPAVVEGTQTIVNGSVIKLRLAADTFVNGLLIPKGHLIFGTATISKERLMVLINSVRYQDALLPVRLKAYDLDGIPGLYVPGAITREVAQQSAERSMQSIDFSDLDASIKGKVTSEGIEAAKSLIGKRIRAPKVTVKSGYKVLLVDENQSH
ncbi:conjugative transposon protein TraM [Solitalea lacus]|uniref:conjugative transposon protein TraM n=1 Tax=Solitalea lacus TaxID=2911172 RepID=UPI001EDA06FD|nr:conjugative transposon protein TraM [Solitalea lacus]UKJ09231.1 conjugative transposon protein TraM [Solitalea lacus]